MNAPRSYSRIVLAFAVLITVVVNSRHVYAETNKEAWFFAQSQFDIAAGWSGAATGALRYSDELDGLSDRFVELQVTRKLSSDWRVTPSFRANHGQNGAGLSRREIRPAVSLQWRGTAAD